MRNEIADSQLVGARGAYKQLRQALADHRTNMAEAERLRQDLAELDAFIASERGGFDPRQDPERAAKYGEAVVKFELLRAFAGRQVPGLCDLDRVKAAAMSLGDEVYSVSEVRVEGTFLYGRPDNERAAQLAEALLAHARKVLTQRLKVEPLSSPRPLFASEVEAILAQASRVELPE